MGLGLGRLGFTVEALTVEALSQLGLGLVRVRDRGMGMGRGRGRGRGRVHAHVEETEVGVVGEGVPPARSRPRGVSE